MKTILFTYPGNDILAEKISDEVKMEQGKMVLRSFPDGESYVRVLSPVKKKKVVIVCSLHRPNEKILALYLLCKNLRDFGAESITLVTPYLPYMRQDKVFNKGEALSSKYFAELLSETVDELITVDPHLHRYRSLSQIFKAKTVVLHAAPLMSDYIKKNIKRPVLIGPDGESAQWVKKVAKRAAAPYLVLHKERKGDEKVKVSIPEIEKYKSHTPVLVDDIISTARTMIETVKHLKRAKTVSPVCIAVHAVFAAGAFENLKDSGAGKIITCNSIPHISNKIDLSHLIASAIKTN